MEDGLWAAVVAGVVAVLSAYLGSMWGRRHERDRWFRDQKLSVYTGFLNAAAPEGGPEMARQRMISLNHLSLAAPEPIFLLAMEVHFLLNKEPEMARQAQKHKESGSSLSDDEPDLLWELMDKFGALRYLMRMDLHPVAEKQRTEYLAFIAEVNKKYDKRYKPPHKWGKGR